MRNTRRQFTREFKIQLLAQWQAGRTVAQLARENNISPVQIYQWEKQHKQYGDNAFAGNGHAYTDEARIADLERKVGQQALEIDFLKRLNSQLHSGLSDQKKRDQKR